MEFQGASTILGRQLTEQQDFLSASNWQSVVLGAALRNVAPSCVSERRQELIRTSSDTTEEGPGSSTPKIWRGHQSFVLPSAEIPLLP